MAYPAGWLLAAYLGLLLVAFVWLKKYAFLAWLLPTPLFDHPLSIIGLSYILFRQIHVLVDAAQGQIENLSLWTYLNYQLSILTLTSGPIQRYQDFSQQWSACQPQLQDRHELLGAYQRILVGVLKICILGALCFSFYEHSLVQLDRVAQGDFSASTLYRLRHFASMFLLYPAYVYFNFSGYCDVVIGAGLLFGQPAFRRISTGRTCRAT